jgi:S-adenosylmethionine-diacylglycerol 3-amino-3-carboxypropyl transferase
MYGVDPRELLLMDSVDKQREFFETRIAPVFDSRSFRALTSMRASLFGLGIPPAQYEALAGDAEDGMIGALRTRTERLACGFPLKDNYFAWQAFRPALPVRRGRQPATLSRSPEFQCRSRQCPTGRYRQ